MGSAQAGVLQTLHSVARLVLRAEQTHGLELVKRVLDVPQIAVVSRCHCDDVRLFVL